MERIASATGVPCATRTSTWRSFATISSGGCLFLPIVILLRLRSHTSGWTTPLGADQLTLSEAATKLGVSHHRMRALVKAGVVTAEQVMRGAPHQIRASDLDYQRVGAFLDGAGRPRRGNGQNQVSMFSDT